MLYDMKKPQVQFLQFPLELHSSSFFMSMLKVVILLINKTILLKYAVIIIAVITIVKYNILYEDNFKKGISDVLNTRLFCMWGR